MKFLASLVSVMLLWNPWIATVRAQSIPGLDNPGFENGLTGWTIKAAVPQVAKVTPEAASMGKLGLRMQATADCRDFQVVSAALPVTAGKSYEVDCWVGGGGQEPGKGMVVQILFRGKNGENLKPDTANIRRWPSVPATGGPHFEQLVLAAAAPAGAEDMAVQISSVRGGATGSVDFDDFSVKELPGHPVVVEVKPGAAHPVPPSDPAHLQALREEIASNPHRGKPVPKIVIKLDDLVPVRGKVHPRWVEMASFAVAHKIKVAFGIIAKGMEEECAPFADWVKLQNAARQVEFWCHGYDHAEWVENGKTLEEFKGTPYEHQRENLQKAQKLARDKLGFAFVSFGAPFNAIDETTATVLGDDPEMKVWMYGERAHTGGKIVLERAYSVTIETPTFIPNFGAFLEGYAHNRGSPYFVMQGHPTYWDADRLDQFTKIVEFLISQNADFVLPKELATVSKNTTP